MNNSINPHSNSREQYTLPGILADIDSLTVFSQIRKHPVIRSLKKLIRLMEEQKAASGKGPAPSGKGSIAKVWAEFAAALIGRGLNCSLYSTVAFLTLIDENPFTLAAEFQGVSGLHPALIVAAANDLARLGRIAALDTGALASAAVFLAQIPGSGGAALEAEGRALGKPETVEIDISGEDSPVPEIRASAIFTRGVSWDAVVPAFGKYLQKNGAGELGLYRSFFWNPPHKLMPVTNPDPVRLADFSLYEDQRSVVVSNTLRFLEGKSANNLLLYGDRGTGKSATVKAVCHEYSGRGLRLVELRKDQLGGLPEVLEYLGTRSMKFVVFIDDLSFEAVDDSFTTLKALLEGGVETRPANTVVYATSNRRHLVKERMADRPVSALNESSSGGEVRAFDAMQEQLSLADRFGVTVIYTLPSQDEYLTIAEHIACGRSLIKNAEEDPSPEAEEKRRNFRENALRWERWFNGRSPRTAAQYVDWIAGGDDFPWDVKP
ncbi:MAG: ATP-binding protein [Treponema sp.]|nr:ATP-binding protein [Treponema sp.]